MTKKPTAQEEFQKEIDKLVDTVEKRVTREVTNYFLELIDTRIKTLNEQEQTTEYDYCEKLGRIKELQELTRTLLNLN